MPSPKPRKPTTTPRRRTAAKPEANGAMLPVGRSPTHEEICVAAYFKWVAAGSPPGDDQAFWYEAERELRADGLAPA